LVAGGGSVLITVPAYQWLFGAHDKAHHHYRRYTAHRLRRVAEAAGFRVRRCGYFNTLLFPLIAAARFKNRWLGRDRSDDAALPSLPLNGLLKFIFTLESRIVPYRPLPFGVSVIALLEPA
jgi:hypothetical protein